MPSLVIDKLREVRRNIWRGEGKPLPTSDEVKEARAAIAALVPQTPAEANTIMSMQETLARIWLSALYREGREMPTTVDRD